MKILINCSNIKIGGGIQVAHSFLNEVAGNTQDTFVIVVSSIIEEQIDKSRFSDSHIFYSYNIKATPTKAVFSQNPFLDTLVKRHQVDKVFTIFGPSYWRPKVTHICGYAKPHYIYKNSPFFRQIGIKDVLSLKLKEFFHLLDFKKNADVLITENPDVTRKISKRLNKKAFTVTNNYNQIFDARDEWQPIDLPEFGGKYLLTISANYPHKNLKIIPEIVQELINRKIDNFKFVVTLQKGDLRTNEEIDKYILYIGKVAVNECPPLYEQAAYMFLPTLLECFSASYAEAMRMERVILTSDLDFARGICGDSAIYFNPLDPIDFVNKLVEIDGNGERQKELINRGRERLKDFDTAAERATKYLDIIKNS